MYADLFRRDCAAYCGYMPSNPSRYTDYWRLIGYRRDFRCMPKTRSSRKDLRCILAHTYVGWLRVLGDGLPSKWRWITVWRLITVQMTSEWRWDGLGGEWMANTDVWMAKITPRIWKTARNYNTAGKPRPNKCTAPVPGTSTFIGTYANDCSNSLMHAIMHYYSGTIAYITMHKQ